MLIFLKLGGSLITDKNTPYTPRPVVLDDLAAQIASFRKIHPEIQILVGHGSGSFGHASASKYGTRQGVTDPTGWRGFAEVWFDASRLNRLVIEALYKAGLPAVTLAPFSMVVAKGMKIVKWELDPIELALKNGLLPVIHGDVIFDQQLGGTILSTENLFTYLAPRLNPDRILLAGLETGIWQDFPLRKHLTKEVTLASYSIAHSKLGKSESADVTGGMAAKVNEMMDLINQMPSLQVLIFSGEQPDALLGALAGENPGTLLHS